jgi:hypothetical protein
LLGLDLCLFKEFANFGLADIIDRVEELNHGAFADDFHECAEGFLGCCADGFGGVAEEFDCCFADDLGFCLAGG